MNAAAAGVSISVLTMEGEDCSLEALGAAADITGGSVQVADPAVLASAGGDAVLGSQRSRVVEPDLLHRAIGGAKGVEEGRGHVGVAGHCAGDVGRPQQGGDLGEQQAWLGYFLGAVEAPKRIERDRAVDRIGRCARLAAVLEAVPAYRDSFGCGCGCGLGLEFGFGI